MSTTPQEISNGTGQASTNLAGVQVISVAYDKTKDGVTVTPEQVGRGTPAYFKDPNGGKLRIVFLSPSGKETDTVMDSELYTLAVGGCYHFKCFFSSPGASGEINPRYG